MRYPASEKLEIIRTVEGSHLPTKQSAGAIDRYRMVALEGVMDEIAGSSLREIAT